MENKINIVMASDPSKNKPGWTIGADTVEEAVLLYEEMNTKFVRNNKEEVPFPNNQEAKFDSENPVCPKCKGTMWDNRTNKKNPNGPDYVCKQDKGECVNNKGFKTSVFLSSLK